MSGCSPSLPATRPFGIISITSGEACRAGARDISLAASVGAFV
jgi:hypothetical protein